MSARIEIPDWVFWALAPVWWVWCIARMVEIYWKFRLKHEEKRAKDLAAKRYRDTTESHEADHGA